MFNKCLSSLIFFSALNCCAGIEIILSKTNTLTEEQSSTITTFLADVEKILPQNINIVGDKHVSISFEDLGGRIQNMFTPNTSDDQTYMGYLKMTGFASHPSHIVLNKLLIEILLNPVLRQTKSQRHHNGENLVRATIIHEIAHFIDFNTKFPDHLLSEVSNCWYNREIITRYFKNCHEATTARGHLSDSPEFKNQMRWEQLLKTNSGHPRSPNSYEYKNANEFFAVNFEYFLVDPEYLCRRPSLFKYFAKTFSFNPFPNKICKMSSNVFLWETGQIKDINPSKVISIDYLHAGPGVSLMSRWGHSMFQLTLCEVEIVTSNSCPETLISRIVVSFRANIIESLISHWNGLIGRYPSQLFILDAEKVLDEYNVGELRDVSAYKLTLSDEQKTMFLDRILENYWSYSGRYYFLTNNCASESFSLLKSIFPLEHSLQGKYVTSPESLLSSLIESHLISSKAEHFYSSRQTALAMSLSLIGYNADIITSDRIKSYMNLPAAIRRKIFLEKKLSKVKEKAAFLLLERYVLYQDLQKLYELIYTYIYNNKIYLDNTVKKNTDWLLLDETRNSSYGIPSSDEIIAVTKAQSFWIKNNLEKGEVFNSLIEKFPEQSAKIDETKENLRMFDRY